MKSKSPSWLAALAIALVGGAGLLAAFIYRQPLWEIITQHEARLAFVDWVRSQGLVGILVFLCLQMLQIVLAVLPGEPVELMAGALYGRWGGLAICLLGVLLASGFIYGFVFLLKERFSHHKALAQYGFLQHPQRVRQMLYLLFFLPGTPKDMLLYVGPFLPVSWKEFLVISTLARIPSVLTSTVAGSSLLQGQWWVAVVIFVVMGTAGLLCIRYESRILDWMRCKVQFFSKK